jgi:hypothetical protein
MKLSTRWNTSVRVQAAFIDALPPELEPEIARSFGSFERL